MKKPRTLADLIKDPRVTDYSDERYGGHDNDGIWLYLLPGWMCNASGVSCVHEWSVRDCCQALHECSYDPEWYYSSVCGVDEARPLLPGG